MLKLYYAKGTVALATHITLLEIDTPFEGIEVDVSAFEQRGADYLAINPKGRVPSLITEHGTLTETPAVLVYLAQIYPAQNLALCDDPFSFARIQSFTSYLCSTVHVAHAAKIRGNRWTDDPHAISAMQARVTQNMTDCFGMIEHQMFEGPWCMGEHYTIVDPYLFTVTRWALRDDVDLAQFPKIAAHHTRMHERPAVKTAMLAHT